MKNMYTDPLPCVKLEGLHSYQVSYGLPKSHSDFFRKKYRTGRWNLAEDEIYIKFLVSNDQLFKNEATRRKHKVCIERI